LNLRLPAPKAGALPGCATPRTTWKYYHVELAAVFASKQVLLLLVLCPQEIVRIERAPRIFARPQCPKIPRLVPRKTVSVASAILDRNRSAHENGFEPVFQSRSRFRHLTQPVKEQPPPKNTTRPKHASRTVLMAYKDEYEVARLYTDGRFHEELAQEFEGKPILRFHLAPPILGNQDRQGRPVKRTFGPRMLHCFRMLATLRRLRGTPLGVFGMTAETARREAADRCLPKLD
jgi:hypothetical protein